MTIIYGVQTKAYGEHKRLIAELVVFCVAYWFRNVGDLWEAERWHVWGKRTDSPLDIAARDGGVGGVGGVGGQEMYGSVSAVKWWSVKSCVNNATITHVTAPIASNRLYSAYRAVTVSPVLIARGEQTSSVQYWGSAILGVYFHNCHL
jgi:hypothetical protein